MIKRQIQDNSNSGLIGLCLVVSQEIIDNGNTDIITKTDRKERINARAGVETNRKYQCKL